MFCKSLREVLLLRDIMGTPYSWCLSWRRGQRTPVNSVAQWGVLTHKPEVNGSKPLVAATHASAGMLRRGTAVNEVITIPEDHMAPLFGR